MRTSSRLDVLDPLRSVLRDLAVHRFTTEGFEGFLSALKNYPSWRSSPTACFLAAKADIEVGMLTGDLERIRYARVLLNESEAQWQGIWEDADNEVNRSDRERLSISFLLVRAHLELAMHSFEPDGTQLSSAEGRLQAAEQLARPGGETRYDDVIECLDDEWNRLRSFQGHSSTTAPPQQPKASYL